MLFLNRTTLWEKLDAQSSFCRQGAAALKNRRLYGGHFGYRNSNVCAFSFLAANVHLELIAIQQAQALVNIADADPAAVNFLQALARHSHAVIIDFDSQPPIPPVRSKTYRAALEARRQSMLDGIFNNGLKQHAGDENVHRILVNFLEDLQVIASEPNHLDVQIVVDELDLIPQRHKRIVLSQQAAQNVRKLQHHATRHVRVKADQRRHGIQRVKKEVRIDLTGERIHPRLQQVLLILL